MWALNQPIYSVRISNQTKSPEIRVIQTYLQKLPIDMINNAKGVHQISLQFFQYIFHFLNFFSVVFSPLPEFCTELCQIFPPVSLILSILLLSRKTICLLIFGPHFYLKLKTTLQIFSANTFFLILYDWKILVWLTQV